MGRARGGKAVTTPWPYPKERARGRLAEMTTWPFPKRGNKRKARSDNPGPYAKESGDDFQAPSKEKGKGRESSDDP